jgi:dTDP-4-amino-4,6-dideoxygalactose transaminase
MEQLKEKGIGTQVHYIPVYKQPYYKSNYKCRGADYPVCEKYYEQTLSLPLFPRMKSQDADRVIKAILAMINKATS